MSIIRIHSLSDPGVDIFSVLTEAQLRNRLEPEKGIFIAESPKVIQVALDKGYEPLALLCEERHITGDAADIIRRCGDMPVYTGERGMLGALTGYNLTRGVLCAMRRPEATPSLAEKVGERARIEDMLRDARRVVVIDGGLRPVDSPCRACLDGLGVPRALDLPARTIAQPASLWIPDGGDGIDRRQYSAR